MEDHDAQSTCAWAMSEHNSLVRNRGLVVPPAGQISQRADTFLRKGATLVNSFLKIVSTRESIFQANWPILGHALSRTPAPGQARQQEAVRRVRVHFHIVPCFSCSRSPPAQCQEMTAQRMALRVRNDGLRNGKPNVPRCSFRAPRLTNTQIKRISRLGAAAVLRTHSYVLPVWGTSPDKPVYVHNPNTTVCILGTATAPNEPDQDQSFHLKAAASGSLPSGLVGEGGGGGAGTQAAGTANFGADHGLGQSPLLPGDAHFETAASAESLDAGGGPAFRQSGQQFNFVLTGLRARRTLLGYSLRRSFPPNPGRRLGSTRPALHHFVSLPATLGNFGLDVRPLPRYHATEW